MIVRLTDLSVERVAHNGAFVQPLSAANVSIDAGELVVVLGESGSGKSTLLHVIAGLLRAPRQTRSRIERALRWSVTEANVKGTVELCGQDVTDWEPRERPVGLVMQHFSLYPHLTVDQNLSFPLKMMRLKADAAEARKRAIKDELRLDKDWWAKYPSELSGGQRQRVALAKMLLRDPAIALCDEAFSSLDPANRTNLMREVTSRFRHKGRKAVVMVTHNLEDAEHADRIIYLKRTGGREVSSELEIYRTDSRRTAWQQCSERNEMVVNAFITPFVPV